ncbi:MAG: hypothetical protein INR73_11390 [Williamsia sp.]|nr:hypothetical protein [Williamsia sp.]
MIADFSIRSYQKIYDQQVLFGYQDFVLYIYLNCLSEENIRRYKKKWEAHPYTILFDNADKIKASFLPYPGQPLVSPEGIVRSYDDYAESYDELWSTELQKFDTPFVATVDADFEVLHPDFYFYLFSQLQQHADLIAASSCYSSTALIYESYSKRYVRLNERNHTWFCIYRKEAFALSSRSHYYYETQSSGEEVRAYDSAAYFQDDLRTNHSCRFAVLPDRFRSSFIHYGAASKNKSLNRGNIGFYRRIAILRTVGLIYGSKNRFTLFVNKATRKITGILFGDYLNKIRAERNSYVYT